MLTVHSEVHPRQTNGGSGLLLAEEGDSVTRVLTEPLYKVARLDKHSTRTASRIENDAVIGLDDVDYSLDDRGRREELSIILRALNCKLHQEVFVDRRALASM